MLIEDILSTGNNHLANQKLEKIKDGLENRTIVVFGSGNLGKKMGNFLISKEYNFIAYADNSEAKWGTKINGIPIISPSKAAELYGKNGLFIISIWSPGHSYIQTKQQLLDLGIKNIVHAAAVMQLFVADLLPHYHFQTPDYFYQHKNELLEVYNMLADDESKKQFLAHIDCRIDLNFEALPIADTENQYFPSELINLTKNEIFLDSGAYDGDTLQEFCKRTNYLFTRYIALEPDPANYKKLLEKVKQGNSKTNNIDVYSFAVGSKNCTLKFDATGGGGAGINENGELEVECKRIDDFFPDTAFTYLKFDIEGAELSALQGVDEVIKKYKPVLAVCIYHLPDDLWNIPLYIKNKYPFYNQFVRTHQNDGLDFVLYAIPA
jgi:FkbM family methyltransferase